METKTAKITYVQENHRSYNGQRGTIYVHHIKYEGSDQAWEYHSQKNVCEKFKVGETKTFETDIVTRGQYTDYKIKPAQDQAAFRPGGGGEKKDSGVITYLSVFSSACNYYAQRTCTTDDVFAMADKAFNTAMTKSTNK